MRPKHFLNFDNFSKTNLVSIIERAIEIKSKSETSSLFDKKTDFDFISIALSMILLRSCLEKFSKFKKCFGLI